KRLQAQRTFDAAQSAYNRREFAQSSTLLSSVDTRLLDPSRQARLREISMTPEMQPGQGAPGLARATDKAGAPRAGTPTPAGNTTEVVRTGATAAPAAGDPGPARAPDPADGGLMDRTRAMRNVLFQKMRAEGLEAQQKAGEKFRAGQADEALELLHDYLARLSEEQLEPSQVAMLKRPVESRLNQF